MTTLTVYTTEVNGLAPHRRGKVRDLYELDSHLLVVATDRLSAFDVIFPQPIPNKGKVLTKISAFWFRRLAHIVQHHLLSTDIADFPEPFRSAPDIFSGRSMLVRKARPLLVECVVRGYLAGSGWQEYQSTESVSGISLPPGLRESERLRQPLFTPSTKAEMGTHDTNITFDEVVRLVGNERAEQIRTYSLQLYMEACAYAEQRGIIIADTKFEFGVDEENHLVWIDEALTPDSSRFWPMSDYKPGGPQPSFDKQFVRDYLLSIQWNKQPPAPELPEQIITTTSRKYLEALERLTGGSLS